MAESIEVREALEAIRAGLHEIHEELRVIKHTLVAQHGLMTHLPESKPVYAEPTTLVDDIFTGD